MNYSSVTEITWSNTEQTGITANVDFEGVGIVPFTASLNDKQSYGVEIFNKCVAGDFGAIADYMVPPIPIPSVVTMRQARRALLSAGLLSNVDAAIDAMEEPSKSEAYIDWNSSQTVQRDWPFVALLGSALELDDTALDDLFILAATL